MAMEHMSESAKHVGDAVSIVTVVGTLAQVLPSIAAIFTIVWTSIRIYETETVQKILGKKKVEDVKED
jgi:chromate transport protein ChrA